MTMLGAWQLSPWLAVAGCLGLLLAPIYMLRVFQGAMYASRGEDPWPPGGHGPVAVARTDLARLEVGILVPLVALMFVLGLYPNLIAQVMPAVAILGLLASGALAAYGLWRGGGHSAYHGFATGDSFALYFELLLAILGVLSVLVGHVYVRRRDFQAPELHVLMLAAIIGMMA